MFDFIIIFDQKMAYCSAKHHRWVYKVAKEKRKVEEKYPNPINGQMLPSMTLDIHILEVGTGQHTQLSL